MNYKTRNWWDRFSHMSIEGEGNDTGGGGGDPGDSGGGDPSGDQGEPSISSDGGDAESIDLTSEDPEVIVNFPPNHKLTDAQLSALMGFNPTKKTPPKDPTVQQPAVQPAPKPGKKATPGQPDPQARPEEGRRSLVRP
jgi:hypothetical protein